MAESLSRELEIVAPNIKVLIVEPGFFASSCFRKCNAVSNRTPGYAQFTQGTRAYLDSIVGNEPGDPEKAVQRIIEMINGSGMAEGRIVPLRVPLGTDGWGKVKAKCEETLKICADWEDVAKSTDL